MEGDKIGRTIDFPTINLEDPSVMSGQKEGVYSCIVKIKASLYKGALYYGPRLVRKESHCVLEIYILNFSGSIYGEKISFTPVKFVRGILNFDSLEQLKEQLKKDIQNVKKSLSPFNRKTALIQ